MTYRSVKGFSGVAQVGMLILFLGAGIIIAAISQLIIGMQIVPDEVPFSQLGIVMAEEILKPENIGYARLSQVLGTIFIMFIPAVCFTLVVNGSNKFWLGFNNYLNAYQVIAGFFIIIVANFMAAPIADLSRQIVSNFPDLQQLANTLEEEYNRQMVALSNLGSWPEFLMAIVIMAFFPALFEEVFFRGALQNMLTRWWKMPMLAIIVSALIFSLIHFSIYLFLSRAILGFVLGLLYYKTKNIWVNVIAHFLNNCIAVAQLFWIGRSGEKLDVAKLDPQVNWWMGVIALIVLVVLFKILNRYSVLNKVKIEAKEIALISQESNSPFQQK